jgi:molybdate ABC transporter permease protein
MELDLSPLWISLKTAFFATCFTFFMGIAAAYWMLGYRGKWKSLIEGLLISPLILPPTVIGFLLLLLLGNNGWLGKLLLSLNISIVFTWYAAVITATVVAFPLMYKTALGAFTQIDPNLLLAARTLGASEVTIFWCIILPLAMPGILAGISLSFARALGEFGATLMLAGNIPRQTQTIPMAIYFAVEAGAMNEAWIWVLVIMIISLSGITILNLWENGNRELGIGTRVLAKRHKVKAKFGIENLPEKSIDTKQVSVSQPGLYVDIYSSLPGFLLDVSFSANKQVLGLLGASGAGKSMILRCIAGIETPTKGRIILNGRVLFDSECGINIPSRHRRIGFLFQNYALFPHLTVAQNIAFGLPKGESALSIRQQVETQLVAVELEGYANRYPRELSGGQQQRVALARALASQPEALLLDEPFSALDTHLRSQLEQQLIASVETYQGSTLFVTHNLEEAYRVCQNLLVLEQGKAIAYSSKQNIFERPNTVSVAQLTGCKNFSRVIIKSSQQVKALDWGCTLRVIEPVSDLISHVGIRAHQLTFTNHANQENTFPCWLVKTSETPHRMTLYLKLNSYHLNSHDYHLQAEVFKEKWESFKDQPLPWYVRLDPLRLILME